jgi:transposase-like protein
MNKKVICPVCFHTMTYRPYLYDQGKLKPRWICFDCGKVLFDA